MMSATDSYYIIGAGGHAKVIIRSLQVQGFQIRGIFDDDRSKHHSVILGAKVIGSCEDLATQPRYPTVVAVGDNAIRRRIVRQLNFDWATVIHPSAIVDSTVVIGPGSVVMAGAVVQVDTVIGAHGVINTGSTIDHDCTLHDFCHVGPGAHIAGHCMLGEGVFVGIGASVIPSVRIGPWSIAGAGSCVIRDLPSNVTAVGVPARAISGR